MQEDLLTGGKFDKNKLFTPEVLSVFDSVVDVVRRIPATVKIGSGEVIETTPHMINVIVGVVFNFKIKANLPTRVTSSAHDTTEDILEWNNRFLVVVGGQFEAYPRLVFTGNPLIPEIWRSAEAKVISLDDYSGSIRTALQLIKTQACHDLHTFLKLKSASSETSMHHGEQSHPHCI